MIQLVVNDIFLDLYENDPPKLTYSIEDITDTKITSVYSKTFRVPATKNNTEFFKTAFEINGFDFDVTAKASAQILYNGDTLRRGYISLTKIFLTNYGDAADYEVVFLGETRDFITELNKRSGSRNEFINSLDYSDLNFTLTWATISQSWQAYRTNDYDNNGDFTYGDVNGGLYSGSLIFPLVDFGNTYTGTTPNEAVIASEGTRAFTSSAWPLTLNRFRPMIRAKTIWDKIFDEAGYTYESNFITGSHPSLFLQVYLSAWGNEPYVTWSLNADENISLAEGKINSSDPSYVTVYSSSGLVTTNFGFSGSAALKEIYDQKNRYNNQTGIYSASLTGDYSFGYGVKHTVYYTSTSPLNQDHTLTFRLMKSGSATPLQSTIVSQSNSIYTYNGLGDFRRGNFILPPTTVNLNAGDKLFLDVSYSVADVSDVRQISLDLVNSYFQCYKSPSDVILLQPFIKNDYKKVDFIRDILTKFRLTMAPSKTREKHFIVEPWQLLVEEINPIINNDTPFNDLPYTPSSYIGSGEILDWTSKLDLSKDATIEPLFRNQKQRIVFKDKEDGDYYNQLFKTDYNSIYGELKVDTANDLLTDERTISTTLSPTIVKTIREYDTEDIGGDFNYTYVPHIYKITEDGNYEPINPNNRLLFWNGWAEYEDYNKVWYVKKEDTTLVSQSYTPKVSSFFGSVSNIAFNYCDIDLNWQREIEQILSPSIVGYSAYDLFWSKYVDFIYDKWSRKISAYFVLDSNDLANWDFNNVIFVKDTYYYVEKIYDVPIGKRESVKVDLIKFTDFNPPINWTPLVPPTPVNVWGDWPIIWNTTTDIWDD